MFLLIHTFFQYFQDSFDKIDTDKDGYITFDEVAKILFMSRVTIEQRLSNAKIELDCDEKFSSKGENDQSFVHRGLYFSVWLYMYLAL